MHFPTFVFQLPSLLVDITANSFSFVPAPLATHWSGMNSSVFYRNISQDLEFQEQYFDIYQMILFSMCTISNIVVFITCWIIKSTPSQVFVVYKYALIMNILLPALLNNFLGYFMQPYLPLPYFVILVLGPLNQGYIFTEVSFIIMKFSCHSGWSSE